jgi:hypothetical protein
MSTIWAMCSLLLAQTVEDDHFVNAVEELRPERGAQSVQGVAPDILI